MTDKIKKQPFCWKCANKITKPTSDNGFTLVGCKEEENIHNYSDAEKLCPVIKEMEK